MYKRISQNSCFWLMFVVKFIDFYHSKTWLSFECYYNVPWVHGLLNCISVLNTFWKVLNLKGKWARLFICHFGPRFKAMHETKGVILTHKHNTQSELLYRTLSVIVHNKILTGDGEIIGSTGFLCRLNEQCAPKLFYLNNKMYKDPVLQMY